MSEPVKRGVRAEHAELTRARILDAALAEFTARGFAGARITSIAAAAGVAVPTIYKGSTNNRNLLTQAAERAMTGAAHGGRVDEQEWWREQLEEPDPERQLALIASRCLARKASSRTPSPSVGARHSTPTLP